MFVNFGAFYCERKRPCFVFVNFASKVGVYQNASGIGTVLHWRPLNLHIFDTHPSLLDTEISELVGGRSDMCSIIVGDSVQSRSVINVF